MRWFGADWPSERVIMIDFGMKTVRVLLVGTALGVAPALAVAQTAPPVDMDGLTALASSAEAAQVLALPAGDLGGILAAATPAQLASFVAVLTPAELDALVALLVANRAEPPLVSGMVSAALSVDATRARARALIGVVQQNASPAARTQIAAEVYQAVDGCQVDLPRANHAAHVLTALSLDMALASRLIAVGNGCGDADAARLAEILFNIIETGDETLASAIEAALALEGGQMLRRVSALRGELEVGAVTPPVPVTPLVPAAPIGAGSSPRGAGASTAGRDAVFAQFGVAGAGLGPGPIFTPRDRPRVVSPVE